MYLSHILAKFSAFMGISITVSCFIWSPSIKWFRNYGIYLAVAFLSAANDDTMLRIRKRQGDAKTCTDLLYHLGEYGIARRRKNIKFDVFTIYDRINYIFVRAPKS